MTQTAKSFHRAENGKITLENVIYDSIGADKASTVISSTTGLKIHSIVINEQTYYPVGIVKEKKK